MAHFLSSAVSDNENGLFYKPGKGYEVNHVTAEETHTNQTGILRR